MAAILIVEDEKNINELMKRSLKLRGYDSFQAFTGQEAVNIASKHEFNLILLDINLPDINGFELIKMLPDVPVIYITARDNVRDRVKGLNIGAEDYIVKPFDIEELLARIQVVLRRDRADEKFFKIKDNVIDLENRIVKVNGNIISSTNREFELLKTLIDNKNLALSRDRLIELVWGFDFDGDERTVDVHIQRLRKKLHLEECIKTVFKYGYRLEI